MLHVSAVVLQNAFHATYHLLIGTHARLSATPRCISSLQQAQSLPLFKQTVNGFGLPVFRYIAAVDFIQQPGPTCSALCLTPYAEIPVAVVESKIWVADFHQVAPLCIIKLTNTKFTDVFRTKLR